MHRWVWDLHYPAPAVHAPRLSRSPRFRTTRRAIRSGPTVLPGTYTVRLTVDGKTSTAPLTVKMDPRVKTPLAGLQKKFKAETSLASMLSATSQAVLQGGSIREQLEKLRPATSFSEQRMPRKRFEKKLNALLGGAGGFFAPPSQEVTLSRVNGQAGTLYQQVWQADAEPTSSQMEALATIERDSAACPEAME